MIPSGGFVSWLEIFRSATCHAFACCYLLFATCLENPPITRIVSVQSAGAFMRPKMKSCELTEDTKRFLLSGVIDFLMDQNPL